MHKNERFYPLWGPGQRQLQVSRWLTLHKVATPLKTEGGILAHAMSNQGPFDMQTLNLASPILLCCQPLLDRSS